MEMRDTRVLETSFRTVCVQAAHNKDYSPPYSNTSHSSVTLRFNFFLRNVFSVKIERV